MNKPGREQARKLDSNAGQPPGTRGLTNAVLARLKATPALKLVWFTFLFFTAGLATLLMVIPGTTWRLAENGPKYDGFDPNLLYVVEKPPESPASGSVDITPKQLKITAPPRSNPTVHLVTSRLLTFESSFTIRVHEAKPGAGPLSIKIWDPRTTSGLWLAFGPGPDYRIIGKVIDRNQLIREESLGQYAVGQPYAITLGISEEQARIYTKIEWLNEQALASRLLVHPGGAPTPGYDRRYIMSKRFRVEGGQSYAFGALVKVFSDPERFNTVVIWYDESRQTIDYAGGVAKVPQSEDQDKWQATAQAPQNAKFARIMVGLMEGTPVLVNEVFLRPDGSPMTNLVPNGEFALGSENWGYASDPETSIETIDPLGHLVYFESASQEIPTLLGPNRTAITVSSFGGRGGAAVVLEDYTLQLPPRAESAIMVADGRVTFLVVVTAVFASLLCLIGAARLMWPRRQTFIRYAGFITGSASSPNRVRLVFSPRPFAIVIAAVAIFVLFSSSQFSSGSYLFDTGSKTIWAYIATDYGLSDLFFLSRATNIAQFWQGPPVFDPGFPYPPGMAYYLAAVGWLYHGFLLSSQNIATQSFGLVFVLKLLSVILYVVTSVLSYKVLVDTGVGRKMALVGATLVLFNPAFIFNASIWGETTVVTLLLLTLSMWLAGRNNGQGAWLALAAALLTRPQAALACVILAPVYLVRFGFKNSIHAMAWTTIIVFLSLLPLSLAISPSLISDVFYTHFQIRVALPEEGMTFITKVGADGYSVWPLVTAVLEQSSSLERLSHPRYATLLLGFSYGSVSSVLSLAIPILLAIGGFTLSRAARKDSIHILLFATGFLGWWLFATASASHYQLYGLLGVILAKRWLWTGSYLVMVGILSANAFLTQYGSLIMHITNVPDLVPSLHPDSSPFSAFILAIYRNDYAITLGSTLNILVFAWLATVAVQAMLNREPTTKTGEFI